MLEILSGELSGLTDQELYARLTAGPFLDALKSFHGVDCKRPWELLERCGVSSPNPSASTCRNNQLRYDLAHRSSESRVLDQKPSNACGRTAVAVSLLALLYSKWDGFATDVTRYVSSKAGSELHLATVLPYLESWFDKGTSWSDAIAPIVSKLILDQHDRIMYEKGKLKSCWLHRTEGEGFQRPGLCSGLQITKNRQLCPNSDRSWFAGKKFRKPAHCDRSWKLNSSKASRVKVSPPKRLDLNQLLDSASFDHAVILTYTFDPIFFEEYCLANYESLSGCGSISVLLDSGIYNKIVTGPQNDRPKQANLRYLLHPVSVPGVFHPKLILLTSATRGLLLVGSANFTRPGLTANAELVGSFDFKLKERETFRPLILKSAFDFIHTVGQRWPSRALISNLRQMHQDSPWLE